jgi:hypothetical protein
MLQLYFILNKSASRITLSEFLIQPLNAWQASRSHSYKCFLITIIETSGR